MEPDTWSKAVLSRVIQQSMALEKRDFGQWLIAMGTVIVVAAGLVVIVFPGAIPGRENLHFEVFVPRRLFLTLIAVLVFFNLYGVIHLLQQPRKGVRVISTSIQSELVRLQSLIDPRAEIYNLWSLHAMLKRYTKRADRLKKPLSFLWIDVKSFLEIDTHFGGTTADFVLMEVVTLLKSAVRGSDAVMRYGGDKFLIILADAPLKDTPVVMGRIANYVRDWNQSRCLEKFELVLRVKASCWKPGETADEILCEAA